MSRIRYIVLAKDVEPGARVHSFETAQTEREAREYARDFSSDFNAIEIVLADGYMRDFGYEPGEYGARDISECVFAGVPECWESEAA